MRLFFKMILLWLIPVAGMAQDTVVTISSPVFNENGLFFISDANGWVFKQGNDTTWGKKDIDISGWKKLSPAHISLKYAGKNGRVESWFRLKIKIDKSLTGGPLGVKSAAWAAADIYIDGQLITSNGNTGVNGKPYLEGTTYGHLAVPVNLKPGTEHTIAVHLVDEVSPVPPRRLKSGDSGLLGVISIAEPGYNLAYFHIRVKDRMLESMWVSVGAILSLLFWLLFFQNPTEKNLRLIALVATFSTLNLFFASMIENVGVSNLNSWIFNYIGNVCYGLDAVFGLLVLIAVFNRRKTVFLRIFIGIFLAFITVVNLLPADTDNLLSGVMIFMMIGLNFYYIISSWKHLKGPQWTIVAGLMTSYLFGAAYIYGAVLNSNATLDFIQLSITGYSLSFPLSLLVYVSMRFKEIINEVRENALQVVQLSEEKKEAALNRQKILEQEVNRQTAEIRTTLDNLKATQAQLIQSEKMASLGELTAGIAHEIQNPLNFVNNFSEVNKEMLEELKVESGKPKAERDGQLEIELINDIIQNEQKINHHGKRADSIVKGMLEHSRSGSGKKEPADINTMADEFMRLSYHGLRSKDKSFNSELTTNFDPGLPKINVVQQDVGRVLLNLFNNAFYAVNQKQKITEAEYKPEVTVTTSAENGQVIIKVKDNGIGIPDAIKEKIMQPFFTTKPTGEGTGLGLSLTYDMVVKGHGGSIDVDTKENEYTLFTIKLPVQ